MGKRDINDVHRTEGVDAARDMHDRARPFKPNGGNGEPAHIHVWRSKDADYPSTPVGAEYPDGDGRIYVEVLHQGTTSFVPKDELVLKDAPPPGPAKGPDPDNPPDAGPDPIQDITARAHTGNASPKPGPQPPAPEPVFDPWARYVVPAFPFDLLPPLVQDYVSAQAAVIGCDPSAMAMTTLGTFSGALHHGFALKMLRNGNWYASPRLWILLVAAVSQRKTPTLKAVTRPLVHYEAHLRDKYHHELRDYEQGKEEMGDECQMKKPEPPPRYVAWDTTVEKLGEILARGEGRKGILILADEISGWLGSMERYANGGGRSDRAFWLEAYDGGPYSVERIKRGETYIQNLSVSIMGSIQPTRLSELQGMTSDGLLQRYIPVMQGPGRFRQDRACEDESYNQLVRDMIFAKPEQLIMTDEALAAMEALHRHLYDLEAASEGLAGGFQTFIGKLSGVAGSLALVLHMAHHLADNPKRPGNAAADPVSEHTVERARRLMLDFILPHAHEFYCAAGTSDGERLRRLASWILTAGKDRIVASDLTTNIADFRGLTLRDVNDRVSPLVAFGWLQPADNSPTCRSWTVTPQVHTQLAERARTEEARKAALARLMGSPRKSGNAT